MKKMTKKKMSVLLRGVTLAAWLGMSGGVQAVSLPAVSNCGYEGAAANLLCYEPSSGVKIYVASEHDDFISYSVNAMQRLANDFGYSGLSDWSSLPAFGSGQIVKLFTFNNSNNGTFPNATGGTGDNKAPGPGTDQTPKNDGQYLGEWPYLASVSVGDMQAFLGGSNFSPVFSFDLNNGANLFLNGQLQVRRNGDTLNTFAFDNEGNGVYTPASLVLAQAEVDVQWLDPSNTSAGCLAGVCSMTVKNNVGSGKPDFLAYAPSFDLRDYQSTDALYFMLRMTGLDSGGEELALTNLVSAPTDNEVPEPGVLALLGIGLAGLAGLAMSRRAKRVA